MGFEHQLREVVQSNRFGMPSHDGRQTALFSATFPSNVALLARDFLRGSHCISLNIGENDSSALIVPAWGEAVERSQNGKAAVISQLRTTVPKQIVQEVQLVGENEMLETLVNILKSDVWGNYRFFLFYYCNIGSWYTQ